MMPPQDVMEDLHVHLTQAFAKLQDVIEQCDGMPMPALIELAKHLTAAQLLVVELSPIVRPYLATTILPAGA